MSEQYHEHDWLITTDANGREYAYCWRCPAVMHEWEDAYPLRKRVDYSGGLRDARDVR